jgi:hypothetical protein
VSVDLSNYVEVAERIEKFYAKYPEGSLRCKEIRTEDVAGSTFLVYVAQAWRTPDDQAPAEGSAWEPVPGHTPYTKDSELMNAETSAWGRAIAALGFEVHRGIASANEVRNRQGNGGQSAPISDKQLGFMETLLKKAKVTGPNRALLLDWAKENLTGGRGGSASKAIDALNSEAVKETTARMLTTAKKWAEEQAAAETRDDSDLPEPPEDEGTLL